jgi:hypothetical protein
MPPFVRFDEFLRQWEWKEGEHITTIGPTGVGKTVLNRELLKHAPIPWVVVFGIKNRDQELYGPFQKMGYELVRRFDPDDRFENSRINPDEPKPYRALLVPRSDKRGVEGMAAKARVFKSAMEDIEETGDWVLYVDDVIFVSANPPKGLGLGGHLAVLWQIGRSEGISLVVSAQEPVNIPPTAYGSASHLFIFKNPDMYRVRRLGELTGFNRDVAFETIQHLPKHQFLYINKDTGEMLTSMVERRRLGP